MLPAPCVVTVGSRLGQRLISTPLAQCSGTAPVGLICHVLNVNYCQVLTLTAAFSFRSSPDPIPGHRATHERAFRARVMCKLRDLVTFITNQMGLNVTHSSLYSSLTTGLVMKISLIALLLSFSVASQAGACPEDPSWKSRLLEQLNALRSSGGVCTGVGSFAPAGEPIRWSAALELVAAAHSSWMAEKGELVHVGRRGEGLGERARQAEYSFERVGENVAMGYAQIEQVMEAWRTSAKHCSNLLDPKFTEVALACVRSANGPWWTITMGRPGGEQRKQFAAWLPFNWTR